VSFVALAATSWVIWGNYQANQLASKWSEYVNRLNAEPGIVITQIQHDAEGTYTLSGLRDPLSTTPESLLKTSGLSREQLRLQLQPYQALHPSLILKRAIALLQPPISVLFELRGQTLHLSGSAQAEWIKYAQHTALYIAGINQVDSSALSNNIPLIDQVTQLLQPPATVILKLAEHTLIVSGQSQETWAKQAKFAIQKINEVKSYQDDSLTLIDTPAYLLKQAYLKLNPPKTVQLFVSSNRTLTAKGYAPENWIKKARQQAPLLAFIKAYKDTQLVPNDQVVLQRAIKALKPPASVQLSVVKQTLFATGKATQIWLDFAGKHASEIEGIAQYDSQVNILWDDEAILQEAIVLLKPSPLVTLRFANGILQASGSATQNWIKKAEKNFINIDGIHSFHTSQLTNITSAWFNVQSEIATISVSFVPTKAQLTNKAAKKLNRVVSLYQDAIKLEPASQLRINAPHNSRKELITLLRIEQVKNILVQKGIRKSNLQVQAVEKAVNNKVSDISFSLLGEE